MKSTSPSEKRNGYRDSLKSMDTEETFDLLFYRPIGYCWALLAKRLHITPNTITIASIFIGVGAGVMFYPRDFWWNLGACLMLMWANSFDSADGQLARMTNQYSRLGRILDGMSSDLWFVAIYAAICLREMNTPGFFNDHKWVIWVVAAATGACHAIQAAMADYYRQFHLFFVKGKEGAELDNAALLKEKWKELSWKKDFWHKLFFFFYCNYTESQEKRTPWMQRLRKLLKDLYRDPSNIPADFRSEFRLGSMPLMKFTNILSFNTRCFALFIAVLCFRQPWLYFAFELTVLNVLLIYMVWRHERLCHRLYTDLKNHALDTISK